MRRIYTCSFKGMARKYLDHRFKNYQHRKRHFNEPMQAPVYIFRHRTCCFMQINQFYVRWFGSFGWCMLYTVIIFDEMRHLHCLCWMVRHLGWSAPLPKTADPKLDTDSEQVRPFISAHHGKQFWLNLMSSLALSVSREPFSLFRHSVLIWFNRFSIIIHCNS